MECVLNAVKTQVTLDNMYNNNSKKYYNSNVYAWAEKHIKDDYPARIWNNLELEEQMQIVGTFLINSVKAIQTVRDFRNNNKN